MPAVVLDDFVWKMIVLAIDKPEEFYKLYQKQTVQDEELETLLHSQVTWAEAIEANESYIISLEDSYLRGHLSLERKDKLFEKYESAKRAAEKNLYQSEERVEKLVQAKTAAEALERFSKSFRNKLHTLKTEEKKVLVDTLVDVIEVHKAG